MRGVYSRRVASPVPYQSPVSPASKPIQSPCLPPRVTQLDRGKEENMGTHPTISDSKHNHL
jgi:hypothetical protein